MNLWIDSQRQKAEADGLEGFLQMDMNSGEAHQSTNTGLPPIGNYAAAELHSHGDTERLNELAGRA